MNPNESNDTLIGKVIGYKSSTITLSRKACMFVSTDGYRVVVKFDSRQIKFIQEQYPRGSEIPLEFYGGEWHVSSKPSVQDISAYDTDVSALEMLNAVCRNVAEYNYPL